MRKFMMITFAVAILPGTVMAQVGSAMLDRMRAADANRDGRITKAEMIAFRSSNFVRIDRNADGFLTQSDIPAFLRGRSGPVDIAALTAQFDASRDGKVSRDEFVNGPTLVFDRADTNRDAALTNAELDAEVSAAKARER